MDLLILSSKFTVGQFAFCYNLALVYYIALKTGCLNGHIKSKVYLEITIFHDNFSVHGSIFDGMYDWYYG